MAEFKDDSCFYSWDGKSLCGVEKKRVKLLSAMPEVLLTWAISHDGLLFQSSRLKAFRTLIANMLRKMRSFIVTPALSFTAWKENAKREKRNIGLNGASVKSAINPRCGAAALEWRRGCVVVRLPQSKRGERVNESGDLWVGNSGTRSCRGGSSLFFFIYMI